MGIELALLGLGFFAVAAVYASVGFGGGSSYLALLTLVLASVPEIRTTALLCNLVVVSGSAWSYLRAGHLRLRRFAPFAVASVPLAYLGATFALGQDAFYLLLGCTLVMAAALLAWRSLAHGEASFEPVAYPTWLGWLLGGGVGLLAGLVGIGGGIFLSPILNHLRWAQPITIAALASTFIFVNSLAGLAGFAAAGTLAVDPVASTVCLLAVAAGGQLGVRYSLRAFSGRRIRLLTAVLVAVVGVRVLLSNGLHWL